MSSRQSNADQVHHRNKKSLLSFGLLIVLAAYGIWHVTNGFSNGNFASLSPLSIIVSGLVGVLLGLFEAHSINSNEFKLPQTDSNPINIIIIILSTAIIYGILDFLEVSLILRLIGLLLFFLSGFLGNSYYVSRD